MYYNTITKKNTPYPYRFKTNQEFVEEYGEEWSYVLNWSEDFGYDNEPHMDVFFGKDFRYSTDKKLIQDDFNDETIIFYSNSEESESMWAIYNKFLIENLEIDYNKSKELVYEDLDSISKYKYRIKTENEFIKEFGIDWRAVVGWRQTSDTMDYLLGSNIDPKYYEDFIDDDGRIDMSQGVSFDIGWWGINKKMIKEKENKPFINYNLSKELVYEGNTLKYNYYIKTLDEIVKEFGDNWNNKLDANWNFERMNFLFGTKLEYDWIKKYINEDGSYNDLVNRADGIYIPRGNDVAMNWYIQKDLIKINIRNINYNSPKQLVYENVKWDNYDYIIFKPNSDEEVIKSQDIAFKSGYHWRTPEYKETTLDRLHGLIFEKDKENLIKCGSDWIDETYYNYYTGYNILIIKDLIELKLMFGIKPNIIKMYNEPKKLVYESIKIKKYGEI